MTPAAHCSSSSSCSSSYEPSSSRAHEPTTPENTSSSLTKRSVIASRWTYSGLTRSVCQEINDLVDEWSPEPLAATLDQREAADLAAVPVIVGATGPKPKLSSGKTVINLASYNFTGLAGNETIKERAIDTVRKYGLGSCGPPGFYGTQGEHDRHDAVLCPLMTLADVHIQLEQDIADFLGTESAIIYSQAFSTISSVIPAFCKRGDIIVADRGVNFAIQKGLQISRSTIRWFDHNDMKSLEQVLESTDKERRKKKGPLTRRFIVTEGIFDHDGAMSDLPKLVRVT